MIAAAETRGANAGALGRTVGAASLALRGAAGALHQWLGGVTDGQRRESDPRHAAECGEQPLTKREFYLDDQQRKYSGPNRRC